MNLDQIAIKYQSDKSSKHHDYCWHYDFHFKDIREKPITLLELGIGGYEYSNRGGSGLMMWLEYFQKARIFGIDLYDKSELKLEEKSKGRIKTFKGSQADGNFLLDTMKIVGAPDIIIDDASHMNQLTIQSFKHLFPWLKHGGYYVIEDIESSWWDAYGFDGTPLARNYTHNSSINFCRWLVNDLNKKHVPASQAYKDSMFSIDGIHFYTNMVIIKKR